MRAVLRGSEGKERLVWLALVAALALSLATPAMAQVASGYSEYYIPGNENEMSLALRSFYTLPGSNNTHSRITITAWSDNTTLYYDHWENGLGFDPANPAATADETFALNTVGSVLVLDNTPGTGIPVPRNSANLYYDGGDRLYVAGGAVTVTRVSYLQERGLAVQAVAWEIYPVKPQLTTYIVPFGQNLSGTFPDFLRTYALIQATANGTTFTVDLDGNGTADPLDRNFDGDTVDAGDTSIVTLQAGESFFLGFVPVNPNPMPRGARATLNSGAIIQGNATLQVKFIVGDPGANYETRGISAFPRGYWTKDYYAPVGEPANATFTNLFLFNPQGTAITIDWETLAGSGNFNINAGATVSFRTAAGAAALPVNGGVYLRGTDAFWGVSTIDSTGQVNEWAYSLLPSTFLYREHFLGWAPGGDDGDDSGVFLTVVQDNTRVFVDTNGDGTAEQTFTLNRLQSQYITDTDDGDLSGTHFWATGPFTMAFGQNPDTAPAQAASGDLGYVAIPGIDFISLVLTVNKSADPGRRSDDSRLGDHVHAARQLAEVHSGGRQRRRHASRRLGVRRQLDDHHAAGPHADQRRHRQPDRRGAEPHLVQQPGRREWLHAHDHLHGREPTDHHHVPSQDDGSTRGRNAQPEPRPRQRLPDRGPPEHDAAVRGHRLRLRHLR